MCSDFHNKHDLDVKFIPVSSPTAAAAVHEEDYQCGICSASFNSKAGLLEHVQVKHRRNKQTSKEQTQPKIDFKSCSDCGTKFRNDFDLYKHRRNGCQEVQEESAPENTQLIESSSNQCSECGLNFKFRIQLIKHLKIHAENPENAEEEPVVGKRKKPGKVIGGHKFYPCPKSWCDYSSKFPQNIKLHLKSRHREEGARMFKCELCPFQTALKGNLKQHEITHSDVKRFVCSFPNCVYKSHWAGNLKAHQGTHKTEKKVEGQRPELKKTVVKKSSPKPLEKTPKISPKGLKKNSKGLSETHRTSSRQRSQVHHSLCEELLNDDFQFQNDEPFTLSDLKIFSKSEQGVMTELLETKEISNEGMLFDFQVTETAMGMPELPKESYATNWPRGLSDSQFTTGLDSDSFLLTSTDPAKPETTDHHQLTESLPEDHLANLQVPELPMPSDLAAIRISDLISPEDPTEIAEPNLPPPASAPIPSLKSTTPKKTVLKQNPRQPKLKLSKNTSAGKGSKATGQTRNGLPRAGKFQCPHCPHRAKNEWLLRGHLVGHGAAEPFYCSVKGCKFQTKWKNLLYSHRRKAHATRYFMAGRKRKPKSAEPTVKCSVKKPGQIKSSHPPASSKESAGPENSVTSNANAKTVPKPVKDPNSKFFRCPFPDCGFKTLYEWNMTRHFKTHKKLGTFSYSCSKCHGKFPNLSSLGRHKVHCNAQPAASSGSKPIQIQTVQKAKWFTCDVADCNYKTRHASCMLCHRKSHDKYGVLTHTCPTCPRKFATAPALKTHGRKCTGITKGDNSSVEPVEARRKLHTCSVHDCHFTTPFITFMRGHQESHAKYGIFAHTCAGCQRKSATGGALLRHEHKCDKINTEARQTAAKKTSGTVKSSGAVEAKSYTCPVPNCNWKTRFRSALMLHRRRHEKFGNFSHNCPSCQRKFATVSALRKHGHYCTGTCGTNSAADSTEVEQLTGRWHSCAVADCNFKTRHRASLWYHQQSHKKYGNFDHTCADCHRKFATAAAVLRHGPMCTGKSEHKGLKCPECPYVAMAATLLRRHSIIHTSERPFACPLGPYTARWSGDVKKHQRRQHPNIIAPLESKSSGKDARAANDPTNDEESDTSEHAHNAQKENIASTGCTFCSYMSRLGKYLTKHMTKCPGCDKSTNENPSEQVPSSTLAKAAEMPLKSLPALSDDIPNFASMLCGFVAQSDSQALEHAHIHIISVLKALFWGLLSLSEFKKIRKRTDFQFL